MTAQPGNYNLQDALNRSMPSAKRAGLGDLLATLIASVNGIAAKLDATGGTVNAVGTITAGGTISAGDTYTVNVLNPLITALSSPGVTVGPSTIAGGDTTTTVAAALAVLLNASAPVKGAGITATSTAAVAHIAQPGIVGNSTTLTATLKGGAVLTLTAANSGVLAGGVGTVGNGNVAAFTVPTLASRP